MNNVCLIGRITRDPDVRYGAQSQMAIARFSLAIDRGKDKNGDDRGADFPNIVCFGKTAELVEKYLGKGRLIGVEGHIQTGSYEGKDGKKVYTTEVVADKVQFLDKALAGNASGAQEEQTAMSESPVPGFTQLDDDDIPF